jgi:glycosidase
MGLHEVSFDRNLHAFFRAAIALRREEPVFSTGGFRWLVLYDEAGTLVFERVGEQARALVVFNRSEQPQTVRLSAPEGWPEAEVSARFVSDGGSAVLRRSGDEALAEMAPLSAAVFLP